MELLFSVICCLVALAHCDVIGPVPDRYGPGSRVIRPEHVGRPQPPSVAPPEEEDGNEVGPGEPIWEGDRLLGDRCPFPPDENGHYPPECTMFIGDHCECIHDDIYEDQLTCILRNRTEYEMLAQYQKELEIERDNERVKNGHASDPRPFMHLVECLVNIPKILAEREHLGLHVEEVAEAHEEGGETVAGP